MAPVSMLFGNPAVKILEGHLWEAATKRYLGEHPRDVEDDLRSVLRKVRTTYQDVVAEKVKEANQQIRAIWSQFKHGMTGQLKTAFTTVLRMSYVDWYAVEAGQLPHPDVIAVPYQLLKRITVDLMPQFLKKKMDFENLDDATLEALASYAADEKFEEVLESARHNYEPFEIGGHGNRFVVAEIIKRDAYFLGEESHHSQIDMVILVHAKGGPAKEEKNNHKATVRKWFDQDRKNRKSDRRFTGDGWEIEAEELKACTMER